MRPHDRPGDDPTQVGQIPIFPPQPAAGGTVYGTQRQRDWLLTGAVAFLAVAVLVGAVFAWQGGSSGDGSDRAALPAGSVAAPADPSEAAATASPTPSPTPSVAPTPVVGDQVPVQATLLRNANSSMCMQLNPQENPDGAPVKQAPCGATPPQLWLVAAVGGDAYAVANAASGRCLDLDLTAGAGAEGALIHQWSCHGRDNQQWRLARNGSGTFQIVSAVSGKCADVFGASVDPGAQVVQWTCHGGANQQWAFVTTPA